MIRTDLLWHGRSAKPADGSFAVPGPALQAGVAGVAGVALGRLVVEHAVLVGHSIGGAVATALAEQRPGRVRALALLNTGPGRRPSPRSTPRGWTDRMAGRLPGAQ